MEKGELKKTLLMPKTGFEMRGNLTKKEPLIIKHWQDINLYEQVLEDHKDLPEYSFHDGPPYANGDIHVGHMLNRLLKDFVVRYKTMSGYKVPFRFGFDTHGLPIENQVIKQGVDRKSTPKVDFRKHCEAYAYTQVERQKEQIRRLGVFGDFDHPYMTLTKDFEANQIRCFKTMAMKGLIYKGLKPVYWSPSSESALAEAEIEYHDISSNSIYVAFNVTDGKGVVPNGSKAVIWTTTPWTMPANLAISVHPRFTYALYKTNRGDLILLEEFKDRLSEELGLTKCELVKTMSGQELDGVITKHPLYDRDSIIIVGEHVTNESGTGLVHTAPGHGLEDFAVCQKYGIKPYCPVDSKGYYDDTVGDDLKGLFYEKGNAIVLAKLMDAGALLKSTEIVHSYPHDWRTKKPLIFRATPQWFCSIEKIKDDLIKEVHKIKWVPAWGEQRMVNMVKDRSDWCISRQRAWGVPIPIIYNEDGSPIIEEEVFDHIIELVEEHGSNIWYELDPIDLLPKGYKNAKSPNGLFTKENDIMDVWFDSGSSFNAVIKSKGHQFPTDLYLEGSDQYRGWFNSSLTISVACFGKAPYKTCVSHGWVLDDKSEKMSKSKGNGLKPSALADVYGVDVLRLWAALVDYKQDVRLSDRIIQQVIEQYRKIRNSLKFLLGNLSDGENAKFDPKKDSVKEFKAVDELILASLETLENDVIKDYDNFDFSSAVSKILTFMSNDLSSFYLDINKDVLYCNAKNDLRRRQVQTVIYRSASSLIRMLEPILPFTMEEAYSYMPDYDNRSALLLSFPKVSHEYGEDVLKTYEEFKELREKVMKSLEVAREDGKIGSSQEAMVWIANLSLLKRMRLLNDQSELARLFIVSKALVDEKIKEPVAERIETHKCPRCWNYVEELVNVDDETAVCPRCAEVLKGLKNEK